MNPRSFACVPASNLPAFLVPRFVSKMRLFPHQSASERLGPNPCEAQQQRAASPGGAPHQNRGLDISRRRGGALRRPGGRPWWHLARRPTLGKGPVARAQAPGARSACWDALEDAAPCAHHRGFPDASGSAGAGSDEAAGRPGRAGRAVGAGGDQAAGQRTRCGAAGGSCSSWSTWSSWPRWPRPPALAAGFAEKECASLLVANRVRISRHDAIYPGIGHANGKPCPALSLGLRTDSPARNRHARLHGVDPENQNPKPRNATNPGHVRQLRRATSWVTGFARREEYWRAGRRVP
jgi:hypothetical protein